MRLAMTAAEGPALLYPCIADEAHVGNLAGLLTSHQVSGGNFSQPTDLSTSGSMQLVSFSLTDGKKDKEVGVDQVTVLIDSVNMGWLIRLRKAAWPTRPAPG